MIDRQEDRSEEERPEEGGPQAEGSGTANERGTEESQGAGTPGSFEMPVKSLTRGDIVDGLIVHIDDQGALVDVGTKSEGHIAAEELAGGMNEDGEPLAVGDKVAVYVVRPEDEDGHPVLSKKRADYERVWLRLTDAHKEGDILSAMVTERVKGGLVVDLGLRGFLPASHVRTRNVHALDRFVGQALKVKIIEVDRARKRVVVSHKEAIEVERRRRREQVLASLEENRVYKGTVRRVTDYGAFVDLGGVDGLLHVTEMSWTRVNHPSEVVKVGDKIDVMVLRFDREQRRISLGLRQILPDPWEQVREEVRVGQMVKGKVSRVVPFGAFVRLENGIEGIIPNSELPGDRHQRAQDLLSVGDSVEAKVLNIRPRERRMTLSLRQAQQARERQELRDYIERQQEGSRVTIGDLVGNVLSEAQVARGDMEAASEEDAAADVEDKPPAEAAGGETGEGAGREEDEASPDTPEQAVDAGPEEEEQREQIAEGGECSSSESPGASEAGRD
jgi:ribosomal protein S1